MMITCLLTDDKEPAFQPDSGGLTTEVEGIIIIIIIRMQCMYALVYSMLIALFSFLG